MEDRRTSPTIVPLTCLLTTIIPLPCLLTRRRNGDLRLPSISRLRRMKYAKVLSMTTNLPAFRSVLFAGDMWSYMTLKTTSLSSSRVVVRTRSLSGAANQFPERIPIPMASRENFHSALSRVASASCKQSLRVTAETYLIAGS
ncbi:hypothetical protein BKA93DRAFT_927243 [Sparassis latifolia]